MSHEKNENGKRTRSESDDAPTGDVLKKGPWTPQEDAILAEYVKNHGEGNWDAVKKNTGIARCGKSCRIRWLNHLKSDLKKGPFSEEEERKIIQFHATFGNKWAKMAAILPGRNDNEIKNYWNTRVKKCKRDGLPLYPPDVHAVTGKEESEQGGDGVKTHIHLNNLFNLLLKSGDINRKIHGAHNFDIEKRLENARLLLGPAITRHQERLRKSKEISGYSTLYPVYQLSQSCKAMARCQFISTENSFAPMPASAVVNMEPPSVQNFDNPNSKNQDMSASVVVNVVLPSFQNIEKDRVDNTNSVNQDMPSSVIVNVESSSVQNFEKDRVDNTNSINQDMLAYVVANMEALSIQNFEKEVVDDTKSINQDVPTSVVVVVNMESSSIQNFEKDIVDNTNSINQDMSASSVVVNVESPSVQNFERDIVDNTYSINQDMPAYVVVNMEPPSVQNIEKDIVVNTNQLPDKESTGCNVILEQPDISQLDELIFDFPEFNSEEDQKEFWDGFHKEFGDTLGLKLSDLDDITN